MRGLILAAMDRARTTILILIFLVVAGIVSFQTIPKEANPDIAIPMIYVSMTLEGVSPEDGERLLVRPMEQELRSLEGVEQMSATASEGHASVLLEFDAGFDSDQALQDVREKVDIARADLPAEAEEPRVNEVNVALFPVLSVGLSGPLSQQQLITMARDLQNEIEAIPQVLEAEIAGDREDMVEVVVDPQVLQGYGIDYATLGNRVARNNQLIPAGSLDTGAGRMALKVPGLVESIDDVMTMPLKVADDSVVTFGDVATLQRTFKDPQGFARIDGEPAVVLEISKRAGANIIETVHKVQALLDQARPRLPDAVRMTTIMDQSEEVDDILSDLLNNVLTAIVLVLIIVVAVMGPRSALLVGMTIPGAFLTGILLIWALGYTLNIVVLFSLILVAGMLVDGAIVVSELADRNRLDGMPPRQAWAEAAIRMAWPVIASTATTLAVFIPLLFWPGVVGEFMKFLPITVILCLLMSLAMALIFLPILGGVVGGGGAAGDNQPSRFGDAYRRLLDRCLTHPGMTLVILFLAMIGIYGAYGAFNHGVEFFPEVEPDSAQIHIRARGDLSVHERDAIVREVEQRLYGLKEVEALYARSRVNAGRQMAPDVIGTIQFQFVDWEQRRPASRILADLKARTADIPGVVLEFRKQQQGPGQGKPIELQVRGLGEQKLDTAADRIRATMDEIGGFVDVEDDRSLPGIEWQIDVNREAAARFGADVVSVGNVVQLVTNGLVLSTYRPEGVRDEVDIRVRLPELRRNLDQFERLTLKTRGGQVPITNFMSLEPSPKTGVVNRVDGQRAVTIKADVAPGERVNERLEALRAALPALPDGIRMEMAGENEDQKESARFLGTAFVVALFLMFTIMVTQFNSLYQAVLVLSAIVLSTAGVLLGLLFNAQPFGVVMVGMGIIALAGIVVNNNIVLIDTFNVMRRDGVSPYQAALETGCLRLRPVLLTAVTTILGLMPMVLGVNVDLLTPSLGINAPSTQWWTQLSSAIAGGLAFATVLTLLVTPILLLLGERWLPGRGGTRDT
ncbi:efflux RND transporter permease subunit [Halomonadaceae bacterium KBTZ08]